MSTDDTTLSRGALIKAAGGAGLAVAFGARVRDAFGADAATAATCVLTPEVTEGPYWIDTKLTRRDIREGKAGLPLVLAITVVNAKTCRPIKNADVELWHCDAQGNYSGFDSGSGRRRAGRPRRRRRAADEHALPPRASALERRRGGNVPHGLPGVVSRPHAAHPHEGAHRPGSRRAHGPALLQRGDHRRRLQAGSVLEPRLRTTRRTRAT